MYLPTMMKYLSILLLILTVCECRHIRMNCESPDCNYDFSVHCLQSGHFVLGDCKLKEAICQYGETEAATFQACVDRVTPPRQH